MQAAGMSHAQVPSLRLSPGGTMHMNHGSYEDDEEIDVGSPVRSDSDHGIGSSEHTGSSDHALSSSDNENQSENWTKLTLCTF